MRVVPGRAAKLILGVICLLLMIGILIFGLWPFHAPKNDVAWATGENGLWFGEYGSTLSSETFANPVEATSASIELWIKPGETFDSNDLISFYSPENPRQFRIEQSGDDVFVSKDLPEDRHQFRNEHIAFDHIFRKGVKLLVTVTSGQQGTKVYKNGTLAKVFPRFAFTSKNLTGLLIVANSPVNDYSWAGHLQGLALYGQEFSPSQVMQHYQVWSRNDVPPVVADENPIAIYPFDEGQGAVVHNRVTSQPNLSIPAHYFVLKQVRLAPPWKEYRNDWGYWKDVLINIGGFVPFGLFFCAYFARAKAMNRPVLVTILVGGMTSLFIEFTQSFLPTRDSSLTDVTTNTLGTALGAALYQVKITQMLFTKVESLLDSLFQI